MKRLSLALIVLVTVDNASTTIFELRSMVRALAGSGDASTLIKGREYPHTSATAEHQNLMIKREKLNSSTRKWTLLQMSRYSKTG